MDKKTKSEILPENIADKGKQVFYLYRYIEIFNNFAIRFISSFNKLYLSILIYTYDVLDLRQTLNSLLFYLFFRHRSVYF